MSCLGRGAISTMIFPVKSPGGIAANTMETMIALCNLVGFRFASDKLSP